MTLEEAADRVATRELLNADAHCAERRDIHGQMALFTADAQVRRLYGCSLERAQHGAAQPGGARTNLRRSEPLRRDDAFQRTGHSDDLRRSAATGESDCLAHHVSVERDWRMIMIDSIRSEDTFTRSDGPWPFSERRLYVDWTEARPISP
jgi:hypothetical protein